MEKPSLWWNYVSGAARYLEDTVSATSNYRVLLVEEAPYMEQFLHLLSERLQQWDSSLHIDEIQADEWDSAQDVGESLMYHYANQTEYHPMDGTRPEYIARNNLLAGRVLIVRETNRRKEWINTAIEYAKFSSQRNGLIILTYSVSPPLVASRKGVKLIKWDNYITNYDMQLFASYCIADRPGMKLELRNYITQLASRMSGTDPELCSRLAIEEAANDAMGLLQTLASNNEKAKKLVEHPQFVYSIIWEAQIQIVFPIIERLRRCFIERYSDELQSVLPQRDDFDKVLQSPEDMELRHMWYYYFKIKGFRSSDDDRSFRLLYNARNDLAHLDPLDSETVMKVVSLE